MRTDSAQSAPAAAVQSATSTPVSSSRLPPEVIAHIQRLAEKGEEPTEIKYLRATFELVSKEWYNMVDYFTHIVITQLPDVTRLTTRLRSSKLRTMLGSKTKAITVDCEIERAGDLKRLYSLFKWVNGAECLDLSGLHASGGLIRATKAGTALTDALASFRRLRHFRIDDVDFSLDAIKWLASRWPELRTFSLGDDCSILDSQSAESDGPLAGNSHLEALSVGEPILWSAVGGLLANLPPSLSTLQLFVYNAFYPDLSADSAIDCLVAVAPSLVEFRLRANTEWLSQPPACGRFDRVVAKLANVESITIPACAVTNLAALLGPLPRLAKLCLRGTSGPQGVRCEPRRLAELVAGSVSLQSVVVGKSIFDNQFLPPWTADEQNQVECAAKVKGVEVVWE